MAKAWRNESAASINQQRVRELTFLGKVHTPAARTLMQQRRAISKQFKPKGSGNWLLDGLLLKAGFKAAVYGDSVKRIPNDADMNQVHEGSVDIVDVNLKLSPTNPLTFAQRVKNWWNKR